MKGPVLISVIIVALLGGVGGLAFTGIINIPGITPVKKVDWKADLLKIYKEKKGSVKGDVVSLKDATKEEVDAFQAAAKAGGLEPVAEGDGVKSAKLVAFLKKEGGPATVAPIAKKPADTKPDKKPTTPTIKKAAPTANPDAGVQTIADLWNKIDVAKLLTIQKTYKDPELATILLKMDQDHVSELLSQLPDARAAALSRELQKQGAILPTPSPSGA